MTAAIPGVVPYERRFEKDLFDCGEADLNVWLREQAAQATKRDSARTYVTLDGERVIGYYAICTYSLVPEASPPALRIGRHHVPAILLARLAVDARYQGKGLGGILLIDALLKAATVAETAGTRVMVVHALHDVAAAFYEKHGFQHFESTPLHLYLPMQDVRATLSAGGLL